MNEEKDEKRCRYCGLMKASHDFEVAVTTPSKIYKRRKCRDCKRVTQKARVHDVAQWLREYKKTRRCEKCGFADFRALEFHHRDPSLKEFEISNGMRGFSRERLMAEIAKCALLCANCHRIEHYGQRGELD